jgi:hypothetical protein
MAGLPLAFSSGLVQLGKGHVWWNPELPATGLRPTLTAAADGTLTPDGTLSAGAIHIGYTAAGAKATYKPNFQDFEADESTAPVISALIGEPTSITGVWWQLLDMVTMSKMIASNYSTASGYAQNTFGGKGSLSTAPIIMIAPLYADPTKIVAIQLYKALNVAGFEFQFGSKEVSASPFEFRAQDVTTRPIGDRIGIMWKTT